ncbi:agmatine deiminase family protein [Streptomyces sp. NPDC059193]|uniref:agmatine deiminase family protein n=1 Tax=Streptomyces sp. NPDC059193 TaxID=3346763 RepID=UPI0036A82C9E
MLACRRRPRPPRPRPDARQPRRPGGLHRRQGPRPGDRPLPQTTHGEVAGTPVEVGYLNFYLPNGGCVVPVGGDPDSTSDAEALAVLAAALPGRKVVGVPTPVLAYGGGGIHCITQQLPKAARA